jgi:glutamate racemase
MNIGFFDSGLGGLTILKAVTASLPDYDYIYYGDTEHVPYGNRPETEIYELTVAAVGELCVRDCALIIVACNTVSAASLRRLQDEWLPEHYPDRRVLGMIVPTIEVFGALPESTAVLLATKRTVDSGRYLTAVKALSLESTHRIIPIATPQLVPLIEAGKREQALTEALTILDACSQPYDTVILGCTHYTVFAPQLREVLAQRGIRVLSQDGIIPAKLADYLSRHPEITNRLTTRGTRTIHLTAHRPDYDRIAGHLLGGIFMGE